MLGLVVNPEATEAYDSMLHRNDKFWEGIEARKAARLARMDSAAAAAIAEAEVSSSSSTSSDSFEMLTL
jgi:hypothetical protein